MIEIKYRAWDIKKQEMILDLHKSPTFQHIIHNKRYMVEQYIGLNDHSTTIGSQDKRHPDAIDIYQGDILQVDYIEANAEIFKLMKDKGDKSLIITMDTNTDRYYLTTCWRFLDQDTYYSTDDPNGGALHFLRYLIQKGVVRVIGNIHQHANLINP